MRRALALGLFVAAGWPGIVGAVEPEAGIDPHGLSTEPPVEPRLQLRVQPEVGMQWGTETYELTATIGALTAGSTLTYPVSAPMAGGRATASYGVFTAVASFHRNIANPTGNMLDQDFLNGTEFSHTESRTEATMWTAELALRVRVAELSPTPGVAPFSIVGGYRHASNAFDVYGLSGWQLGQTGQVAVSLPDALHALHYDAKYEIPFLGIRVDGKATDTLTLSGEGRVLAAWSTHEDDHLLRHKLGHADMQAFGWSLAAELRWDVADHVYLGALGEIQVLHGSGGTLKQHFYADDPGTTKVESPATPIIDGSFSYKSDRQKALGFVGVAF